jgi:hypothetical protein
MHQRARLRRHHLDLLVAGSSKRHHWQQPQQRAARLGCPRRRLLLPETECFHSRNRWLASSAPDEREAASGERVAAAASGAQQQPQQPQPPPQQQLPPPPQLQPQPQQQQQQQQGGAAAAEATAAAETAEAVRITAIGSVVNLVLSGAKGGAGKGNAGFAPFKYTKTDHFTKTGLGQTAGERSPKTGVSLRHRLRLQRPRGGRCAFPV